MKTNKITLIACACIAWLFGCAGAPEDEREGETDLLGTSEQPLTATSITDDGYFRMGVDGCGAVNPSNGQNPCWPTYMRTPTAQLLGAAQAANGMKDSCGSVSSGLCASIVEEFCNNTAQGTVCGFPRFHGQGGQLNGSYTDFALAAEHVESSLTSLGTLTILGSHTKSPFSKPRHGGARLSLNSTWANSFAAADRNTVRQWAVCRFLGVSIGLSTNASTTGCMGVQPTTVAQYNARKQFDPADISGIANILVTLGLGIGGTRPPDPTIATCADSQPAAVYCEF